MRAMPCDEFVDRNSMVLPASTCQMRLTSPPDARPEPGEKHLETSAVEGDGKSQYVDNCQRAHAGWNRS